MNDEQNSKGDPYRVVALRYRPQAFSDLVGQNHIATALSNAITQSRVGHAYLFTGARGVGKTSSARIFAKCLNCENGPSIEPCNECDICETVSIGEDVDVLEIDGASNRGIDEIRLLRSNAAVRPSRSRFKIYIIDEVHMLTTQAFNALLKTLEEPPQHVKFIFCTTDPQKIPITVLSRCQRFDFSPVQTDEISKRLREIADNEGVKAEEKALALLARRANGSMRDSQSLLEQLFSFCGDEISVDEVHQLLGIADMGRIGEIGKAMANRDAKQTLNLINQATNEGVNAGQLAGQLLGYYRDVMAVRVGCGEDTLLSCTASDLMELTEISESLGLETILTIVQVLDAAVVRMQSSLHAQTLLEVAAIRVCNLENLDSISDLVNSLAQSGGKGSAPAGRKVAPRKNKVELKKVEPTSKKNEVVERTEESPANERSTGEATSDASALVVPVGAAAQPSSNSNGASSNVVSATVSGLAERPAGVATGVMPSPSPAPATSTAPSSAPSAGNGGVTSANIATYWSKMLEVLGGMAADMAAEFESLDLQDSGKLVVTMKDPYHSKECSKSERKQKIESAMAEVSGHRIKIEFEASKNPLANPEIKVPKLSRKQQIRQLQENEFVKQTMSMFDAEISDFYQSVPNKE